RPTVPIKVICPGCSAKLKVPEGMAGKKVRCLRCRAAVPVPEQVSSWGEQDQGDSVREEVPAATPHASAPAAPDDTIPGGTLFSPRRPTPPAAPVAAVPPAAPGPPAPVGAAFVDDGNPFAFDAAPSAPLTPSRKQSARAAPGPATGAEKSEFG